MNGVIPVCLLQESGQDAGYDYPAVQAKVNELVKGSNKKSVEAVAKEVLAGKWGNGEDRKKRLRDMIIGQCREK